MDAMMGRKANKLFEMREEIRAMEDEVKAKKRAYTELSEEILDDMEKSKLDQIRSNKATISLKKTDVANVKDWDKLYNYIHKHKAYHLLYRRVSDAAYREELDVRGGQKLPGVETFTRRSLGMLAK